jgi:hypothetical protein
MKARARGKAKCDEPDSNKAHVGGTALKFLKIK